MLYDNNVINTHSILCSFETYYFLLFSILLLQYRTNHVLLHGKIIPLYLINAWKSQSWFEEWIIILLFVNLSSLSIVYIRNPGVDIFLTRLRLAWRIWINSLLRKVRAKKMAWIFSHIDIKNLSKTAWQFFMFRITWCMNFIINILRLLIGCPSNSYFVCASKLSHEDSSKYLVHWATTLSPKSDYYEVRRHDEICRADAAGIIHHANRDAGPSSFFSVLFRLRREI